MEKLDDPDTVIFTPLRCFLLFFDNFEGVVLVSLPVTVLTGPGTPTHFNSSSNVHRLHMTYLGFSSDFHWKITEKVCMNVSHPEFSVYHTTGDYELGLGD